MTFERVVIGDCTLICGDARSVLPSIDGFDRLITDPPYGIDRGSGTLGKRGRASRVTWPDTVEDVRVVYVPIVRMSLEKSGGRGAVTPGTPNAFEYPKPRDIGAILQPCAVGCSSWGRATWQPVLFYGSDPRAGKHLDPITFTQTGAAEESIHPCPKPLAVMSWLVERASLPGDVVCDPMMGSGTTIVACIRAERAAIGIESDREYFTEACRRIERAWQDKCSELPFDKPPLLTQRTLV